MHPSDELIPVLKKLRLSGVLQSLDLRVRQAADDNLAPSEFHHRLLTDEVERREAKQLGIRLRRASFEHAKTVRTLNFTFNPAVAKLNILGLATCAFVARRENVCLVGQTGVGKRHLAQALGHRACIAGYADLYTPGPPATHPTARCPHLRVLRPPAPALHEPRPLDHRRSRTLAAAG